MKNIASFTLSLLLATATQVQVLPSLACSFANETYFTYTNHPDLPLKPYAAGHLGILQSRYARSYLYVAYRYLSGAPLTSNEQDQLIKLWDNRLTATEFNPPADASTWLKARAIVPGASHIDSIETERAISQSESWQRYCNCQTSAFETAAKTLQGLVTKYGASSQPVKDWLQAQDKVFANCGQTAYSSEPLPAQIPDLLPAGADADLQKDRAYQIAAAHFYAQDFVAARQEFESIAGDANSRWKSIAGYLAVRSIIRQASLSKPLDTGLLAQAQEKLKQLIADPSYANMSVDLAALNSFIAARLSPEQHLQDLAQSKTTADSVAELTKTIDILVKDDGYSTTESKYSELPDTVKKPELVDWIMTSQLKDEAAKHHAFEQFRQTKSLPWLVTALKAASATDPEINEILQAAQLHESSAARWMLFYHINRLNIARGNADKVRTDLDKVLSLPPADLPPGSLNLLKTQRLGLARNLDEFVRFGVQKPLCVCYNGGIEQVPDDVAAIENGEKAEKQSGVFTPEAGDVLDNKLPLSVLKQLSTNQQLPANLRNNIAWTSWVRAQLINEDAMALQLAQVMKPLNKAKEKLVNEYLAASSPEARKFAAAFLMLQFSSAQPDPSWGPLMEDGYGDASGWWWSKRPIAPKEHNDDLPISQQTFDPLFLTPVQKSQVEQQLSKLAAVGAAPNYLGNIVLAWAKAHPEDQRLPQALHLSVKATRYGSADDNTRNLSKQAFQLLHTRYKTSTWAQETPYWY